MDRKFICMLIMVWGRVSNGPAFFCIFVKNKIYVIKFEMLEPALMARNHKF